MQRIRMRGLTFAHGEQRELSLYIRTEKCAWWLHLLLNRSINASSARLGVDRNWKAVESACRARNHSLNVRCRLLTRQLIYSAALSVPINSTAFC